MKPRRLIFPATLFVSLLTRASSFAATYQWDPNGITSGLGGTGAWDITSSFWDLTGAGLDDGTDAPTPYTFTTADKAIFGGTGGAVAVGTAVSLNQLSVDTTGYSFTGSKITFGGTGATLTANADFTIANAIGGSFDKVGSGAVTLTGLTTFNTVTVSAGTLTRAGSGDNDSSASIVNGGTLILANTAANGTSSVTLNSGTVRLNGTNDVQIWNGGTLTLNGGTFEQNGKNETVGSLVLNGGSITGLGTLTSGSVIDARGGSSATILAGTLGLTKTTAGTVTLTAANTYSGTTTISGGTLQVGNGGSTGSLGVGALVNNGTLTYNLVGTSTVATLGSGGITGITGSGSTSITADTINFGASGGFTATTSGNQSYIATRNTTTYPKGMVFGTSGAYNFTTTGGASITMKGDIGATAASTATVNLDTSSGNGAINLDFSVGRSNQFYNIGSITANAGTGAINWTGTYGAVRGSDSSQSTPITLTGAINMTANFQSQTLQTLTLNATGSSTVTGNLLGTINLVKGGSQTLTLSGVNTFTGNVLVSAGELQTSATNNVRSLGADTAGRTVTVASGATLKFMGNDAFGNGLSTPNPALLISGTVTNGASKFNTLGNVTLTGGLLTNIGGDSSGYQAYSLAGSVTVNGTSASSITTTGTTNTGVHLGTNTSFNVADATNSAAADLTVSAPLINRNADLGGAGGFTKSGAGTMLLSAANTFTGNVVVSAGELQTSATNNVRSLGADTAGRTVTVASGATLKFLGSDTFGNAGSTPNVSLLISGTVTNVAGKLNTLGNVTLSGGLLTNQGGFGGAYQAYSLAGSVTVNGTSASSITTTGTTFTGVHLGSNTSFNVADATSSAAADLAVSAPLINRNGDLGGAGGLTKSGAGTMTLSGANTYTGATTVSGGTLEVGGAGGLSGTPNIVVNSGGTLLLSGNGGTNTKLNTAATMNLAGGTLQVSNSISSALDQTLGALTLTTGSVIDFGTFAGGNTLRFADSASLSGSWSGTLSIYNWTDGADHLFFGNGTGAGLQQSQLDQIKFYSDGGSTVLPFAPGFSAFTGSFGEVTPVPEPSSVATVMGLLGLVGWRERRKANHTRRASRS